MHRLQQHILSRLIHNPSLRYARLKPDEVEGNLFMYHLRSLMREGLVVKQPDGAYALSPAGQNYADKLSLATFTPRAQPRLVTLIAVQNEAGQWLLQRRKRQPLFGLVGFPYGKVHLGESVVEAANRELKEKAGITAELRHAGDGYITMYQNGEAASQIFFHLFSGTHPHGKIIQTERGESFWGQWEDVPKEQQIPSVPALFKLMKEHPHDRFFAELSYELG